MPKPIIKWVGGKRKLLGELLAVIPEHHCFCEVFCGGAALFFAKDLSPVEVINDINGDLINLYWVVKSDFEKLAGRLEELFPSRQLFMEYRNFREDRNLPEIERAARFYYVLKCSFGGVISGVPRWGFSKESRSGFNPERVHDILSQAHRRLRNAYVENRDFQELILTYDGERTFFYCDPPYLDTHGYGVEFDELHYRKLADLARNVKGKILISANDHPVIRKLFDGMVIKEVRTIYTIKNGNNDMQANELLISNYEQDLYDGNTGKTGELFA
ncbi:DNA adenine methylase [Oxalobacter aliiformigenes]|uniref:DNA adenine methylase n=1 Tax=Oxalobacter aliiformigenes TaxID=2946593 RepID=UPI0022AFFAA5|nr:DNA adenine methylase [Oxalobacter aliiformigenes]MCZ4065712.1 DNA adenine methylase [Oxalobacter aliiformigenes]WAV98656.1 DNA adenine methylase [Oxalobacter aliiformigenes]